VKRLLLDTHVVLWWDDASPSLGRQARRAIADADVVFVSAASEWEFSIKAALGKVVVRRSVEEATAAAGFEPLPVSFEHASRVRQLELVHKDPFDRLLVAAAVVEGLTVVSADEILGKYPIRWMDAAR
jgi:PIN domain nuclease of toxin-antitoxin system